MGKKSTKMKLPRIPVPKPTRIFKDKRKGKGDGISRIPKNGPFEPGMCDY